MAIYHLSVKIIGRKKGKSSVAAAAYRAGEKIKNEYDGQTHNYENRKDIEYKEIIYPAETQKLERKDLWNLVENTEKRKDAQLAREIEIALPLELSKEERIKIVQDFCKENFIQRNIICDIAIHNKDNTNPHAHILTTTRPYTKAGFGQKDRQINDRKYINIWRENWEKLANKYLEKYKTQISSKTLKQQGIERIPQIHIGASGNKMHKKGKTSDRYQINQEIKKQNKNLQEIQEEIDYYKQIENIIKNQENIKEKISTHQDLIKQYQNKENQRQEILQDQQKYIDYGQEKNKQLQEYTRLKKEIQKYEKTTTSDKIIKNIKDILTRDTTAHQEYQKNKNKYQKLHNKLNKYIKENQEQKIQNIINKQDKQIEEIEKQQEQIQIKIQEIQKEIKEKEEEIYKIDQELQEKIKDKEKTSQYIPLQDELIKQANKYIKPEKESIYKKIEKYKKETGVPKGEMKKNKDRGLER